MTRQATVPPETFDVIVIGAGQAGLALGYFLKQQGCRFVILDGAPQIGSSWRTRYESLVLFTPAWTSGLPGMSFPAPPDHYPTKDETADFLVAYAARFNLPVRLGERVSSLRPVPTGYEVATSQSLFLATQVVVATGPFQRPYVPPLAQGVAEEVFQVHSARYRNPAQLPLGEALVVGAGNSGAQIAAELAKSRKVYLSQGSSSAYLPAHFMGRDFFWWMQRLGIARITASSRLGQWMSQRTEPLIGSDLRRLAREQDIDLLGRAVGAEGHTVMFEEDRTVQPAAIVWATGFQPDYAWIEAPVLDERGAPVHARGVTAVPGLYFLGLRWQNRWDSAVLGGVGNDAAFIAKQIEQFAAREEERQIAS